MRWNIVPPSEFSSLMNSQAIPPRMDRPQVRVVVASGRIVLSARVTFRKFDLAA